MEEYQALYRRFRPQTFSDMVGQKAIVRTLRNQVRTGRAAHAYLFCGSRGTGKTSAAKILARAVNCLSPKDGDPCGECEACRSILSGASLDVAEFDAASNSRVEEMRDLLAQVDYPPQFGKKKVYIIDEVHMLSNSAFNALLKTLEEPPEYMMFILATTDPQKVPATILSRCQRFDFGRFTEEELIERMKVAAQGAKVTDEAYALIAQSAEGGMRDALSLLDMCLGLGQDVTEESVRSILGAADRGFLFSFVDCVAHGQEAEALRMVEELFARGNDVTVFLKDLNRHFRLLLMARVDGQGELRGVSAETASRCREQAQLFSVERLVRLLDLILRAEADARWASSPRAVLEVCVLRACEKPEEQDVQALLERIGELENKLSRIASGQMAVRVAAAQKAPAPAAAAAETEDESAAPPPVKVNPSDGEIWNRTVKKISAEAPMLTMIRKGRFTGCEDHTWRVEYPADQAFYITTLNSEKNRAAVEGFLAACGADAPRFEAVMAEDRKKKQAMAAADRSLELLADAFGRENIQVTDSPDP